MIDYLVATKKCFSRLATSVMYNPSTKSVIVTNNSNPTGHVLTVSISTVPPETFGDRVTAGMLSFRQQIAAAEQ